MAPAVGFKRLADGDSGRGGKLLKYGDRFCFPAVRAFRTGEGEDPVGVPRLSGAGGLEDGGSPAAGNGEKALHIGSFLNHKIF